MGRLHLIHRNEGDSKWSIHRFAQSKAFATVGA